MATSSILTNFTITEKEAAERFVEALETASAQPPRKATAPIPETLRDPKSIKELMSKRKAKHD